MDAIVGRFGYVTIEGDRLGWYVGELRQPGKRIEIVRTAGGVVTQFGDREAAGHARLAALEKLLSAIGAYRTVSDQVRMARSSTAPGDSNGLDGSKYQSEQEWLDDPGCSRESWDWRAGTVATVTDGSPRYYG